MKNTGYRIQDTGYRIQDTGYRIQDTGTPLPLINKLFRTYLQKFKFIDYFAPLVKTEKEVMTDQHVTASRKSARQSVVSEKKYFVFIFRLFCVFRGYFFPIPKIYGKNLKIIFIHGTVLNRSLPAN